MHLKRLASPALRPFVKLMWALDDKGAEGVPIAARELVLPTGCMHLAFRLSDPLRLYAGVEDRHPRTVGHAVMGGARSTPYLRDLARPSRSVGALLGPGAAELLFGVPSDELAERHTPLEDLWDPAGVTALRQRLLAAAAAPDRQLDILEGHFLARLPGVRGIDPAVAYALRRFELTAGVNETVSEIGYSHRWFIALFRRTVGLSPKRYCRVLRFQRALQRAADAATPWVEVALAAGYADQPHFSREFREFACVTPGEYRSVAPPLSHHVAVR